MALPEKLKSDGIREALIEVRFQQTSSPELTFANLLSVAASFDKSGRVERLPIADIPAPIRRSDPGLAFQPLTQITFPNGRLIRIGEQSVSYHALQPYPGWAIFKPEIDRAINLARGRANDVKITGLGFRYLNMLNELQHIKGVESLNVAIQLAGEPLSTPWNLNYAVSRPDMNINLKVAAPEFVQGIAGIAHDFNALVDIDVRTLEDAVPQSAQHVLDWFDRAHDQLKMEFFRLLNPEVVRSLS